MNGASERPPGRIADIEVLGGDLRRLALSSGVLGATFAVVVGFDIWLLLSGAWAAALTALQTLLMAATTVILLRGLKGTRPSVTGLLALFLVAGVGWLALLQKWWIVAQAVGEERLPFAASYRVMAVTAALCSLLVLFGRGQRFARYFAALAEHPARQTALSFVILALFGAFLLSLPVCVRDASRVAFVNALFMATSAVCVTGLAVHTVSETYSFWGQLVLLTLAQIGGLGIMVLSASLTVLTGRKLRARSSFALAEVLDADSVATLRGSIARIVLFSLALEALGAVLLYIAFAGYPEVQLDAAADHPLAGAGSRAWSAIFHAVSSFCNAGFSLSRDGLVPFVGAPGVCAIVMALIVLGGVGFPVLSELSDMARMRFARRRPNRLSLHTRTVLIASAGLIVVGAVATACLEWRASLAALPVPERLLAALFQSVSMRTAGFNTVDVAAFSPAGLMLTCLLMFIGASPGGTGGGVKTTTFAALLATFRAELRGPSEPRLLGRRLPETTVRRAVAVSFASAVILTGVVLFLLISERHAPLALVFEAVSAFGTVGLSTGLTASLSVPGKLVIIATMLVGRVGPVTLALAASERGTRAHHRPPHERVMIG